MLSGVGSNFERLSKPIYLLRDKETGPEGLSLTRY